MNISRGADMSIRPIETRYAGCRFRSRLEARWAVFFDTLGIEWEYEPEGYLVGPMGRPYLPDFWLPGERVWVEVKGSDAQLDLELLVEAAFPEGGLPATDRKTPDYDRDARILILGPVARGVAPWKLAGGRQLGVIQPAPSALLYSECGVLQTDAVFTDSGIWIDSDGPTIADNDRAIQWQTQEIWGSGLVGGGFMYCSDPARAVQRAYSAARSARFEHGENGTPAVR